MDLVAEAADVLPDLADSSLAPSKERPVMDVEAYFLASRRLTTPPPPTPASRRPRRLGWRSWRPPLWPGPLWRGRRQGDLGGALLTLPVLLGQARPSVPPPPPTTVLLDVALVAA